MEIKITNNEYWKDDPENIITTLKNFIDMRHMTLSNPKFNFKKSLDTLARHRVKRKKSTKRLKHTENLFTKNL